MNKRIVVQYIVLSMLFSGFGMALHSAIYVTFLIKNGLNLFEVNIVNATYFLTLFLCEIPTGAFADTFGRKRSFILSCVLLSLSLLIYGLSASIVGFILAEIIGAVGSTFRNGAFQAWFVDSLKHKGYTGEFTKVFAKQAWTSQISGGIGAVIGGYLYSYDSTWPWFAGSIGFALTAIVGQMSMREDYFVRVRSSSKHYFHVMKETALTSIRYGINDKAVRFILLITFMQIFAVQSLNMYWQPNFKDNGVTEIWLGYIFFGISAALAGGSIVIGRVDSRGKEKSYILWTQIVTGLAIMLASATSSLSIMIISFLVHELMRGMYPPLKDNYLHERIPDRERATITSFCSIAPHIGGVFGLIISGLIAQKFGIPVAWAVSGCVFVFGAMLVMRNGKALPG